jgi:hypothetical protein
MDNPFDKFADTAKSLSRNPLGIIALFIVLVYGIAALVFGLSGAHLEPIQKWPLIWFLVIFPVLVLLLFGWLVASHHTKLYSPTDYLDKEGFFRALTPQEQKFRINKEIESLSDEIDEEKRSLATSLEKSPLTSYNSSNLRSNYMLAEELVFRELEAEFRLPVSRHVGIFNTHIELDGAITSRDQTVIIEIKFTQSPNWSRIVRSALGQISKVAESINLKARFLLVIVTQNLTADQRLNESEKAKKQIAEINYHVELRHYDIDELKMKFGLSEGT